MISVSWEPAQDAEAGALEARGRVPQHALPVLGLEAPLWTETVHTIKDIEYMVFPRLIGIAELAWVTSALLTETQALPLSGASFPSSSRWTMPASTTISAQC